MPSPSSSPGAEDWTDGPIATAPRPIDVFVLGPRGSGKSWLCKVVFEGRNPLDLVVESPQSSASRATALHMDDELLLPSSGSAHSLQSQPASGSALSPAKFYEWQPRSGSLDLCPGGFRVVDFPGEAYETSASWLEESFPGEEEAAIWRRVGALIYVVDAQEELRYVVTQDIHALFKKAKLFNPRVTLNVFINKIDGDAFDTDESRLEVVHATQRLLAREMQQSGGAAAGNVGGASGGGTLISTMTSKDHVTADALLDATRFHLTSSYGQSCREAWSLVLDALIPKQKTIVELLNELIEACHVEKAFLLDSQTKLILATDHNPVDHQTLELCGDAMDLVLQVEVAYGADTEDPGSATIQLSPEMVLHAKRVSSRVGLVCVVRKELWSPVVMEHNLRVFAESLVELSRLEVEQ